MLEKSPHTLAMTSVLRFGWIGKLKVNLMRHDIFLQQMLIGTDHAVYIDTSTPGVSYLNGPRYEQRIDEKYLNISTPSKAYRVETFRSSSSLTDNNQHLRCYFVYECKFVNDKPDPTETDLAVIADKTFLEKVTPNTKDVYQSIVKSVIERTGPVIEMFEVEGTREKRLVIGYKQGSSMGLFSALSDLYHYYGCTSARKYVGKYCYE